MKKVDFVTLIFATVGGLLFALGMCMCLLPEWNAFAQGVVLGAAGAVVLLAMVIVRRRMQGKPALKPDSRMIGGVLLGAAGALLLGLGMCMTMVWEGMLVWGILVGIGGIVLLLCLIPCCKGLK